MAATMVMAFGALSAIRRHIPGSHFAEGATASLKVLPLR
jgi:hypothetical protein